jgi:hypothetical protein
MQTFVNFISIFEDSQFCLEEEPISSLLYLVETFQMEETLLPLINSKISSPQSLEEAIPFLSKSYSADFKIQFEAAMAFSFKILGIFQWNNCKI